MNPIDEVIQIIRAECARKQKSWEDCSERSHAPREFGYAYQSFGLWLDTLLEQKGEKTKP